MIYPTLTTLMEKVDSKYTLVVAVSKRARQLIEGEGKLVKVNSTKPVTIAVHEIAEGKVICTRNNQTKKAGEESIGENTEEIVEE